MLKTTEGWGRKVALRMQLDVHLSKTRLGPSKFTISPRSASKCLRKKPHCPLPIPHWPLLPWLLYQKWVGNVSKMCFANRQAKAFGVRKHTKYSHFTPIANFFGTFKITKCVPNALLCDQKWVKRGSKWDFQNEFVAFSVQTQVNLPYLETFFGHFGSPQVQNTVENGPFWVHN